MYCEIMTVLLSPITPDNVSTKSLHLVGVQSQLTTLDRTIFERRFKWAMVEAGAVQPEWSAFTAHIERLSSELKDGLVDLARDQCVEASRLLETLGGDVSAFLRLLEGGLV